jgi:hypothetical protein
MKNKLCLINQPAGLGDILLCQKIAKHCVENNYRVIWPVEPVYSYVSEYIKNKNVTFCSLADDFEYKNFYVNNFESSSIYEDENILYIPIRNADRVIRTRSMLYAKYEYVSMTPDNWLDSFDLIRNEDRENELIKKLGLNIFEDYIVVNKTFGTPPNTASNDSINPNTNYKTIEMKILGWERIFDWFKILCNAKEIHTVDTSLTLLLAKLNIKNVSIYERVRGSNASYLKPNENYIHKKLFCNDWNYYTNLTSDGF